MRGATRSTSTHDREKLAQGSRVLEVLVAPSPADDDLSVRGVAGSAYDLGPDRRTSRHTQGIRQRWPAGPVGPRISTAQRGLEG